MQETKSQVNYNTKLLKMVLSMLESNEKTASAAIGELPVGITMPMESMEQFTNIEEILRNSETQKQLVTCLGTIGGETIQECTRRIMKYIMTHTLSLQFTWKGSGEKKAFENTAVCNAVKCAVRKNRLTSNASDKDIGSTIGIWLRGAKDREGGRKQRMKKKTSEVMDNNDNNDNNGAPDRE